MVYGAIVPDKTRIYFDSDFDNVIGVVLAALILGSAVCFQLETIPMSEAEKIKKLLEEQVKNLKLKREEVLSRVKGELDDIDRALRQLGHVVQPTQNGGVSKTKRRTKVDDDQIIAALRGFMKPGESYTAAEILKRADIKGPRFANFKASHKGFLQTQGAKRSMRYSISA